LPPSPQSRPTIVHGFAVPSTSQMLSAFPSDAKFIVPVEITPVTARFQWAAFVDYNPRNNPYPVASRTSVFELATTQDGMRLLEVSIPPDVDVNACHVIELVVALHFFSDGHTPAPPGGDTVQWFYNPNGDMRGCPVADADIDASFLDTIELAP
jgi:hypothetical protein